jgi:signal transduction histidine kinase
MLKKIKPSRAMQFTLFATFLMVVAMLALYLVMVANLNEHLLQIGFEGSVTLFAGGRDVIIIVIAGILAFTVSSIIIDNALNPLEMQKRFVSDASHELATPITIINGHADLMLRHGYTEEGLAVIKEEILRMNGLAESLLFLARSDNNVQAYEIAPTDISALVCEAAEEAKLLAPALALESSVPEKLFARCDTYAIRRVLRILLSNAEKYGGGNATLSAKREGRNVLISVNDSGRGIPKEHLPHIFKRFYRADPSRSRKTGSSGLGLSIAQEIISAHGGQIYAKSNAHGTKMIFSLPSS